MSPRSVGMLAGGLPILLGIDAINQARRCQSQTRPAASMLSSSAPLGDGSAGVTCQGGSHNGATILAAGAIGKRHGDVGHGRGCLVGSHRRRCWCRCHHNQARRCNGCRLVDGRLSQLRRAFAPIWAASLPGPIPTATRTRRPMIATSHATADGRARFALRPPSCRARWAATRQVVLQKRLRFGPVFRLTGAANAHKGQFKTGKQTAVFAG